MAAIDRGNLGGWAIEFELLEWMKTNIPLGTNIVEFGSGNGTKELVKLWNVFSVESNKEWIGKSKSNYCHAPLVNGWFDVEKVKGFLPDDYAAILVDAPTQNDGGRSGILKHLNLFKKDVVWIFDDVNRSADFQVMFETAKHFNKSYKVHKGKEKQFAII
jgi:hypothetical protein